MTFGNTYGIIAAVSHFYFTARSVMELLKNIQYGILNDCYGSLLTPYQSQMLHLYYDLDQSLAEVAGDLGITRQAAHDVIMRAVDKLERYEDKLGLVKKRATLLSLIDNLAQKVGLVSNEKLAQEINKIKAKAEEI